MLFNINIMFDAKAVYTWHAVSNSPEWPFTAYLGDKENTFTPN